MAKIIEKNSIKIGKEAMVILPLKEWEEIKEYIEELEERERYLRALEENKDKKGITLNKLKKKYNLEDV
jgi:PHD/YefM family antitoxin component YafN of YafNO toxin-antitoxin module